MEKTFQIKNLTYSQEDVRKISIHDLKIGKICGGYIVHFFSTRPNPVIFVHAGDPITKETIERLAKKKLQTLNICESFDRAKRDKLVTLLKKLKTLRFEEERAFHSQEIIKEILEGCFYETNGNLLDMILSFHEVFYAFPDDMTESFFKVSTEDYVRNTEVAFFASFLSLVMGYYDFEFIQDIYNLAFLLDVSLQQNLSFHLHQAIELEREASSKGRDHLFSVSPNELSRFKKHPKMSYEFAKSLGNIFNSKLLHENILNQHEWGDGTGFNGKEQRDFFDWEIILSFADLFIGQRVAYFHKGDASNKYGLRLRDLRLKTGSRKIYFSRFLDRLQKYYDYYKEEDKDEITA